MNSWDQYNDESRGFFESYLSISSKLIFSDVIEYMPSSGARCLDVGAGSGRDSAFLALRGCKVTAVEPSELFRRKATDFFKGLDIEWIDDSLPNLKKVKALGLCYDFVLMSAVWMHLNSIERQEALVSVYSLLKNGGVFILTLRLGSAEPDRMIYEITTNEAIIKAKLAGFDIKHVNPIKDDGFKRGQVSWQILVLTKS
jgi:SAM-dependent methyltransferase